MKQPKVHTPFLMSPEGRQVIDELKDEHRVTRSDVIRACLVVALNHRDEVVARLKALW
jgi:hypothetical protein